MQTILIVEDDDHHRTMLVDGLREYYLDGKAQLLAAESAQEAMELVKKLPISILITDMYLEDPNAGFRLIRFVKQRMPRTFIIVTTAFADLDRIQHWMRAGTFEVVRKPFTFEEIAGAVQRALDLTSSGLDRDALVERLIVEEWQLVNEANSSVEQGTSLENLCSLLLGTLPGWKQIESRLTLSSEEFDLVISNESTEAFWREYGTIILVECKNWRRKKKPGRTDFDTFFMKLQRRAPSDCRLGFFVSMNGFARTFIEESRRILREPQVVVPLNSADLWALVMASDRSAVLKTHVRRAVIGATPNPGHQADG